MSKMKIFKEERLLKILKIKMKNNKQIHKKN